MGEETTERAEMSCGSRRADSHLGDLAASRDESEFFDAIQAESNLVQAEVFSGALGSGVQAAVEAGEHSRSAKLLPNIYSGAVARTVAIRGARPSRLTTWASRSCFPFQSASLHSSPRGMARRQSSTTEAVPLPDCDLATQTRRAPEHRRLSCVRLTEQQWNSSQVIES